MAAKIQKVASTLWTHKKKTALAGVVVYWAGQWALSARRNALIRTVYAKQALEFGALPISAEARPRRVTVLGNTSANERHVWDDFTKNALPLLHLSGVEVNVIKAESETQLSQVAAALDIEEADALYVVGGDGTMQRVLTAIYKEKENAPVPIGFAPGGYDNLALKRLAPQVFEEEGDVRRWCESAMALIEDARRDVHITEALLTSSEGELVHEFGIGPSFAGWFAHIEERRRKLWYWGGLKRRFAYFWEMLKRSPSPVSAQVEWEEFCGGCSTCRPPFVPPPVEWRWWHLLTGTPRPIIPKQQRDYSKVVNEECGRRGETSVEGVEVVVDSEQMDDSVRLRLKAAGDVGRLGVVREGWRRCGTGEVATSSDDKFYINNLTGGAFTLHFNAIPEFLSCVYLGGDCHPAREGSTLSIRSTQRTVQLFIPQSIRTPS